MEEFEAEIRGRQTAMEGVVMTMLAHIAANTENPVLFIAQIMDDAGASLRRPVAADDRRMQQYAVAKFDQFADDLLAHINKISPPAGRA